MGLLLALGALGITYARWSDTLTIGGTVETGQFRSGFTTCSTNDPPDTIDPGKDKDVGCCTCELAQPENGGWERVVVTIANAYPCYECQVYVTIENHGTVPAKIAAVNVTSPPEVTISDIGRLIDVVLDPGESAQGTLSVHVEQSAAQRTTYTFVVEIESTVWSLGGTPGFWQNWEQHYTEEEMEALLAAVDSSSKWLGPTTVEGMEAIFAAGQGGTMEQKFLAHYLPTRLDVEAGRQHLESTHDVTGIDEDNYLGLASPQSAKLSQIIAAIEGKYGASPSKGQFEIMKDICDALSNLQI